MTNSGYRPYFEPPSADAGIFDEPDTPQSEEEVWSADVLDEMGIKNPTDSFYGNGSGVPRTSSNEFRNSGSNRVNEAREAREARNDPDYRGWD